MGKTKSNSKKSHLAPSIGGLPIYTWQRFRTKGKETVMRNKVGIKRGTNNIKGKGGKKMKRRRVILYQKEEGDEGISRRKG